MAEYIEKATLYKDINGFGGLIMLEKIDFNELIEKATKERCEITVVYELDKIEINIQPWKPFQFSCPYISTAQKEE